MKRLFLVFSILLANLAAFAGPIDDNCSTIYDSIIAGDISKAEDAGVSILSSDKESYELAWKIHEVL